MLIAGKSDVHHEVNTPHNHLKQTYAKTNHHDPTNPCQNQCNKHHANSRTHALNKPQNHLEHTPAKINNHATTNPYQNNCKHNANTETKATNKPHNHVKQTPAKTNHHVVIPRLGYAQARQAGPGVPNEIFGRAPQARHAVPGAHHTLSARAPEARPGACIATTKST